MCRAEPGCFIKPIILVYIIEVIDFGEFSFNVNSAGWHLETKSSIAIIRNFNRFFVGVKDNRVAVLITFVGGDGDNNCVACFCTLFAEFYLTSSLFPLVRVGYRIFGGSVGAAT